MLMTIYNALIEDELIVEKAGNRIKFYEYPEQSTLEELFVIIDPLDTPMPSDYADNKWLTEDYLVQIDVWSKVYDESRSLEIYYDTKAVAKRVQKIMWDLGFGNYGGGLDEYDSDYKIYRDARRYRGKKYVV